MIELSYIYSYELYHGVRPSIRVNYIKVLLDSMIPILRLIFVADYSAAGTRKKML